MVDGSHSEPNRNPRARGRRRRAAPPPHHVLAAVLTPRSRFPLSSLPLHLDRVMFRSLLSATLLDALFISNSLCCFFFASSQHLLYFILYRSLSSLRPIRLHCSHKHHDRACAQFAFLRFNDVSVRHRLLSLLLFASPAIWRPPHHVYPAICAC